MKYIYGIVGIVLLLSCVMWAISSSDSAVQPGKNALVINDRSIAFAELEQIWQQKPYHYRNQKEFIEDLVLREVLIQEAITVGIADEEQFKRLIQDFFEQSLVKTLLDRKQSEQKNEPSSDDLARFRKALQSRYHLTLLHYQTHQQAQDDKDGQRKELVDDFAVLPEPVQIRVLTLPTGKLSAPFADGAEFVRLRVDSVSTTSQQHGGVDTEEELRAQLQYMQQQQQLENWIQQVRQQAIVHYPEQRLSKGDD